MEEKAMILGEETVRHYLRVEDVIDIVEKTWRWYGEGKVIMGLIEGARKSIYGI